MYVGVRKQIATHKINNCAAIPLPHVEESTQGWAILCPSWVAFSPWGVVHASPVSFQMKIFTVFIHRLGIFIYRN